MKVNGKVEVGICERNVEVRKGSGMLWSFARER